MSKHLSKLQKQAEAAVRKFNEESAAAATAATSSATETSGTTIPQLKSVPPKPKASKPQEKTAPAPASAPKPSAPKASKPEHKPIVQKLPTVSSSSVPSATTSETKSSPTPLKTKVSAGRGTRPSPSKIIMVPSASEGSDEFDDDTLQAIIRNKQERVSQASGSSISLAMDPKVLDYINIWYEDPNTPLDDLKLPPGISHMVATFINEAKWKEQQAKQGKVAKLKKEKFLRQNLLNPTPDALVSTQKAAPPVPTPQPLIEEPVDETTHAEEIPQGRRVDEPAIEEITKENPADNSAPAGETDPAPVDASKPADDSAPAVASKPADENVSDEKTPSPKASKVKKMTPSTSDVKKTRAAEKEITKKMTPSA
ncbi:hypothetical protein ZWY2020_003756 [Hordeum vulgare]|nr:hypothetical protein ZWY2020_003756 [Hordeum vulgare]